MSVAKPKPRRFRVVPLEQGSTLRNLLIRRVAELDRESAAALIRAGGVYVNRLRVRLPQVLVAHGERITVYLEALDAKPLAPEQVVFIHRDADFVILDKPAGVPVAAVREVAVGCLSEALIHTLEAEGLTRPYVGVVHRLDRGASGLVLFTIRSIANKSIHKQFRAHSFRRGYRIRVRSRAGGPPPAELRCDAPLAKRRDGGVEIAAAGATGAKSAVSHFRLVGPVADATAEYLLDVEIETGRTHQIRAHAAHLGFPIVGDLRYGDGGDADDPEDGQHASLCLHARTLDFAHPSTGAPVHAEAKLPEWATVPES